MRSSQDQVVWTIFGAHSAANAVLLVALFQRGNFPSPDVGSVISFFGILTSVTWFLVQWRALLHIDRHENLMKRLDKELTKDNPSHSLFYESDFAGRMSYIPKARNMMNVLVFLFLVSWVVLFGYFLYIL